MFTTVFSSQDASLSELKISNGDTLVVTEGQLPPKVLKGFDFGLRLIIVYTFTSLFSLCCLFFCKGFLKLSVWLHLDPRNDSAVSMETHFNQTENSHTEEQMLEVVTGGETLSHSPSLRAGNMAELRSVGQVEISDEATLEDLKTQVAYEGLWKARLESYSY